jgi:hypothetical protein
VLIHPETSAITTEDKNRLAFIVLSMRRAVFGQELPSLQNLRTGFKQISLEHALSVPDFLS